MLCCIHLPRAVPLVLGWKDYHLSTPSQEFQAIFIYLLYFLIHVKSGNSSSAAPEQSTPVYTSTPLLCLCSQLNLHSFPFLQCSVLPSHSCTCQQPPVFAPVTSSFSSYLFSLCQEVGTCWPIFLVWIFCHPTMWRLWVRHKGFHGLAPPAVCSLLLLFWWFFLFLSAAACICMCEQGGSSAFPMDSLLPESWVRHNACREGLPVWGI